MESSLDPESELGGDMQDRMTESLTGLEDAEGQQELIREDGTQLVTFSLHEQLFGVNIQNVMEVKQLPELTDVFHTPDFVVGVVNLRGDIIAVIDIGLFFGLQSTELSDKKMVILQYEEKELGVVADRMKGVQWIEREAIQPPPPTVEGVSSEWIEGIIQEEDDPLIQLDIPALFHSERIQDL